MSRDHTGARTMFYKFYNLNQNRNTSGLYRLKVSLIKKNVFVCERDGQREGVRDKF